MQDTCLKAWSCVDQYDRSRELRPWLFQILRNEFYQHKRRNWRLVDAEIEPLMSDMSVAASQPYVADAGVAIRAMDALSDDQREAFILVVAGGFTYEEAGQICECAAGTIKSRVNRARKALLDLMERPGAGAPADDEGGGVSPYEGLLDEIARLAASVARAA